MQHDQNFKDKAQETKYNKKSYSRHYANAS